MKETSQQPKNKDESAKKSIEMAGSEGNNEEKLPPGFRFHPTDEELITFYLLNKITDSNFVARAIGDVDLNKNEPWELPAKAKMGEKEWYFFSLRDRKYPTGVRTNRATNTGYWKTTGKDKEIFNSVTSELVGMKKTLVFYRGRAPRGEKSNWVMHEYRFHSKSAFRTSKDEWVVCRVFQKSSGAKKYPQTLTNPNSRNILLNPYALDPHAMFQHQSPIIPLHLGDPTSTAAATTTQFLFANPRSSSSTSSLPLNNPFNHLVTDFPDLLSRVPAPPAQHQPAHLSYPSAAALGGPACLTLSGLNLNLAGGAVGPPVFRPHHHHHPHHHGISGPFSGLENHQSGTNTTTTTSTIEYCTDGTSNNNPSNGHPNNRSGYVHVDNCMDLDNYWPPY